MVSRGAERFGQIIRRAVFVLLDLICPKDNRLVVFSHADFTDNSRALFEYLTRNETGLHAVWLTETAGQSRAIRTITPGARVSRKRSWQGFWIALRARAVVLSFFPEEFSPFSLASGRKRVVMLWHAISIKRSKVLNQGISESSRRHYARGARHYAMMIASSGVDQLAKAATHGVDARKVVVTGLPRSDRLIRPRMPRAAHNPEIDHALNRRTILYAPTFRAGGRPTKFFPFDMFDAHRLNEFLTEQDAYMLLRPHKIDLASREQIESWTAAGCTRLISVTSDVVADVADLLDATDVLMTDYSSIFLDFLAVDRPIIFLPYDQEEYLGTRGLLYDYDTITPGARAATQDALMEALRDGLEGAPSYAAHRKLIRSLFHAYTDGRATERVAESLATMLGIPGEQKRSAMAGPIARQAGRDGFALAQPMRTKLVSPSQEALSQPLARHSQ